MKPKASIHCRVRFGLAGRRKVLRQEGIGQDAPQGRTARVALLMALAIRLEALIAAGHVPSYAGLARLVGVSRARLTQIASLTLLAPDIQEAILFLPPVVKGRDPITERHLRPLVAQPDWQRQRATWKRLTTRRGRSMRATKSCLSLNREVSAECRTQTGNEPDYYVSSNAPADLLTGF